MEGCLLSLQHPRLGLRFNGESHSILKELLFDIDAVQFTQRGQSLFDVVDDVFIHGGQTFFDVGGEEDLLDPFEEARPFVGEVEDDFATIAGILPPIEQSLGDQSIRHPGRRRGRHVLEVLDPGQRGAGAFIDLKEEFGFLQADADGGLDFLGQISLCKEQDVQIKSDLLVP